MTNRALTILGLLSAGGLFVAACGGDDDTNPSGTGGMTSGSGGITSSSGGTPSTGGSPSSGGTPSMGGMGGMTGVEIPDVECEGCAVLYVPLSLAGTGTDFEIDFGADDLQDLSDSIVTVTLRVVTNGNAGGFQFYAKNGESQQWATVYSEWTDLADATSAFVEIEMDLSALDEAEEDDDFDKEAVRFLGINIAAGDGWDTATWGDTFVFVDSITFSDGAIDDIDFEEGLSGLAVNEANSPIVGSAVSHQP